VKWVGSAAGCGSGPSGIGVPLVPTLGGILSPALGLAAAGLGLQVPTLQACVAADAGAFGLAVALRLPLAKLGELRTAAAASPAASFPGLG
jgi:hypothetical protein